MRILFILLLLFPTFVFSQGWEKTYGGPDEDEGYSVQQTTDGGYTSDFGNGNSDIYRIKINSNGIITFITGIPSPKPNRKPLKTTDFFGRDIQHPKFNQPFIEIYDEGSTEKKIILE